MTHCDVPLRDCWLHSVARHPQFSTAPPAFWSCNEHSCNGMLTVAPKQEIAGEEDGASASRLSPHACMPYGESIQSSTATCHFGMLLSLQLQAAGSCQPLPPQLPLPELQAQGGFQQLLGLQ